ncbi:MAG TPA: DJ-1/PfpI family protein, partial [Steroidobacteraceae bacterium]|nr:DJ-1/PfpI family protein [Steroidobacteraceae bacterium]
MPPKEVLFALLPGVVLLDVAGPADAFRGAERRVPGSYRLRFIAPQPSVTAAAGLTLGALEALPERLAPGTLLVLTGVAGGALDPHEPAARRLIEWLRSGVAAGVQLLGVCAGSVLAARAGLLAGRECTTHHDHLEELRRAEPR